MPSRSTYLNGFVRFSSSSGGKESPNRTNDHSVSIQDVTVSMPPRGSGRSDLVPTTMKNFSQLFTALPNSFQSQLRWMLQKDLVLKQDFCVLGQENMARDRRSLVLLYSLLIDREIEYVALSKDISDSDLKQRKEVIISSSSLGDDESNNDNKSLLPSQQQSSVYVDQAPVRAAINGRLLILDGIEKAERNVLPTLNNLLENREMSLDDGSMLVSSKIYDEQYNYNNSNIVFDEGRHQNPQQKVHRVHPDFRVVALGNMESTLDPPLRSRFQAKLQMPLEAGELYECLVKSFAALAGGGDRNTIDEKVIKELVYTISDKNSKNDSRMLSFSSVLDATKYLAKYQTQVKSYRAVLNAHGMGMIGVDDFADSSETCSEATQPASFITTPSIESIMHLISTAIDSGYNGIACVGPKGCGKSAIINAFAEKTGRQVELFSLFKDMTLRDLLVTRSTDSIGNTTWINTPLTRAVISGNLVILDGIDKLSPDTLSSIALLLEQGQINLPDGERLIAHKNFSCIALGHPPDDSSWITPEISNMFYWIKINPLKSDELKMVLRGTFPNLNDDSNTLDRIISLRDNLDEAIESGAADNIDEQETLLLSLRKIKHICKRLGRRGHGQGSLDNGNTSDNLPQLVHDALVTSLMPHRDQQIVQECMSNAGISSPNDMNNADHRWSNDNDDVKLDEDLLKQCRRKPRDLLLVPDPVFEENPGHNAILQDILEAHAVDERALLIMGFQGVGKNRVVDYLLNKLQAEREYVQLHRDTTVQSLLVVPSIEGGRILYKDSPLVRAAINGRILVIDEADKAPVEVVALLKGLIEDNELSLPDGRILRWREFGDTISNNEQQEQQNVITIHPDFRIWALANPAGYPFHGNDLAKEMSDVFSCHTVSPLDQESQARILKSYGPHISEKLLRKIIRIWQDLNIAHQKGVLAYPFSIREAVSVVRHLAQYPDDGLDGAIENVIAFDRHDTSLMKQLSSIFSQHGVKVPNNAGTAAAYTGENREGGISTPRTRSSMPKHGKETTEAHVGGNQWAGGTGGSDTAGLGGRGGPYRLDLGHKVHQVSDEMKAAVSKEARERAKAMADAALEKKLKELNMGKGDWNRYDSLRQRVEVQIQQLKVHLKDMKRRKEERVWLRRQQTGELDDSRIVDALAGEKDVFKRRAIANEASKHNMGEDEPMYVTLVVDVSASMYRFNGYDGRLERLLEATLMIMEVLGDDERFKLKIVGHNGDSHKIALVDPDATPTDPATQLRILETMVAHTQYTWAGDNTLEAIRSAMNEAHKNELVLVISDANLRRYRIKPEHVAKLLQNNNDVHGYLILIGSTGDEASHLTNSIPNQRAQLCENSEELPLLLKNILSAAAK